MTTAEPVASAIRVSIIVVNYNGGPLLARCIESLVNSCQQNDEIILIDNASQDGSAEAVARQFPDITVIYSPTNLGFGAGNNLGVQHARGHYLAFLNPDAIAEQGWLDPLISTLETDPQIGLTTAKILLFDDPEHINTCGNDVHISGLSLCRGMGAGRNTFAQQQAVNAVSGAAFAMRRDLYQKLGGFDADFFLYMEDTDLSLRARLAGYRCVYVPCSIVCHKYQLRFGPHKTFYQERNRYRMLLKCLRWPTFVVLLPALLLAEVVSWGFVLLRDRRRLHNKLRAYASIVLDWHGIMEQRQSTQALRRISDQVMLAEFTHSLEYEQTGASLATRLAHWLFDPLFRVSRSLALSIIQW